MSIFKREQSDFPNQMKFPASPQIFDLLQLSRGEREAKKKAQDALARYRFIRKERIRIFQKYIQDLPVQKTVFSAAS